MATFREVFPHVSLWSGTPADFLLVGSRHPMLVDPARLRQHVDTSPGIRQDLERRGMSDPLAILADFVLAEPDLARFSEGGLLNTDDLPLLEFSAPLSMYRDTSALTMRVLDRFRTSQFPPLAPGTDPTVLNVPAFRYQLAAVLEKKGQLAEAQRFLDDVLAADPRHVPSLILRGQVLRRLGFPLRAEADFHRAVQLDPRDAGAHGQLGRLYAQQGLPDRAEAAFRRMEALAPGAAEPTLLLARLSLEARRWDKAAAEAGRATALAPREVAAWDLLAQAHAGGGAWQEARAALRQGLALAPRHPGMLEQLGQATLRLGDRDEAERALRAALRANPRSLQARLNLARLYREAGEKRRGLEELQVAVRLHPASAEAQDEYERALANLEGPVTRQGQ
jgi:tetratricopeptide (TPR) repeat protein